MVYQGGRIIKVKLTFSGKWSQYLGFVFYESISARTVGTKSVLIGKQAAMVSQLEVMSSSNLQWLVLAVQKTYQGIPICSQQCFTTTVSDHGLHRDSSLFLAVICSLTFIWERSLWMEWYLFELQRFCLERHLDMRLLNGIVRGTLLSPMQCLNYTWKQVTGLPAAMSIE